MNKELKRASADYWAAKTPAEDRNAYARMLAAGAEPAYGIPTLKPADAAE